METLVCAIHDYLVALREKEELKKSMRGMNSSDENWGPSRSRFLTLDERCESLVQGVVEMLMKARIAEDFEETLAAIPDDEMQEFRAALSDRGQHQLLSTVPLDFAETLRRFRRASALFTAVRELNQLRLSLTGVPPEQIRDHDDFVPEAVDRTAWAKVLETFVIDCAALHAQFKGVDPEDVQREVSHNLTDKLRKDYDRKCELVVNAITDLVDRGTFEDALYDLEHELLVCARDMVSRVPQRQRHAKTDLR